jgi:hypothetical protein
VSTIRPADRDVVAPLRREELAIEVLVAGLTAIVRDAGAGCDPRHLRLLALQALREASTWILLPEIDR